MLCPRGKVSRIPVDSGGISVPDIHVDALYRFAGIDIEILNLQVEVDTIAVHVLLDILPNKLASDVVGANGDLGRENTARVGAENGIFRSVHGVVQRTGLVVVDGLIGLQGG